MKSDLLSFLVKNLHLKSYKIFDIIYISNEKEKIFLI